RAVVTEDVIRQDLRLDDADGVECLLNEEIFAELAHMGYEKPPPKLMFYKAFFFAQWKFLIHILVQCLSAKRTVWNEFSCSMASGVICLATSRKFNFFKYIFNSMGRIDDVSAATKDVNAAEPNVFDDEDVTMTMAQKLIKIKAEKAKILDEQIAKRAQVLQQQYDDKEENIDWNVVAEQIKEKHFDNIKKYQSLKRKPVSISQARKNMIIYLKNMAGYKMTHCRGMTYDKVRPIFEREYKKVQTLFKPDKDVEEPTKKRVAEETLLQESFKKLKAVEVNYPLTDWEIHSEGSRTYWKIIRVGGITEAYQSFKDMLKGFSREDLVALWRLVKEKFSLALPSVDKEKAL
nr:synaptobrevin, longin-like domain protein [Tanacetum cinerariifolium]